MTSYLQWNLGGSGLSDPQATPVPPSLLRIATTALLDPPCNFGEPPMHVPWGVPLALVGDAFSPGRYALTVGPQTLFATFFVTVESAPLAHQGLSITYATAFVVNAVYSSRHLPASTSARSPFVVIARYDPAQGLGAGQASLSFSLAHHHRDRPSSVSIAPLKAD
ncbi:hypothetical protein NMY22_g16837 [Coprinellus aureogranulatus]|nr:hypothetical protein NMY22_g16837 [Coprinellus aureogranulatus]